VALGGAEAIHYAARGDSSRVSKLVLLAPTAPFMKALWATWREDFPAWVRASARAFFDENASEAMLDWGVSLLTSIPLYVHLELGRTIAESDLRPDLAKIDVPTLFLHGAKDASVPVEFGRAAAKMIRDCRYVEYETAAHGLFLTHADEVNREILAFTNKT
jgi:non-heme chloroperoxidase